MKQKTKSVKKKPLKFCYLAHSCISKQMSALMKTLWPRASDEMFSYSEVNLSPVGTEAVAVTAWLVSGQDTWRAGLIVQ